MSTELPNGVRPLRLGLESREARHFQRLWRRAETEAGVPRLVFGDGRVDVVLGLLLGLPWRL